MSSQLKLNRRDLASVRMKMKKLEKLDRDGLNRSLKDFALLTSREMTKVAPVDTGKLMGLITAKAVRKTAIVESKADYSGYVEFGGGTARRGNPPRKIPYFYPTINRMLTALLLDINNKIKKALR
jgi:phage gpG-like protein